MLSLRASAGEESLAIALTVNGSARTVDVPDATTLLEVLRNHLGLMGTRYGCGLEQCGSCMVLVDEQPVYACTREAGTIAGRRVTTIESLGTPDKPHPLQQAFLDEQAGQCGYCLSGSSCRPRRCSTAIRRRRAPRS